MLKKNIPISFSKILMVCVYHIIAYICRHHKKVIRLWIGIIICLHGAVCFCQNMIYLQKSVTLCKITAISEEGISYIPSSGKATAQTIAVPDAILLFNKSGHFLIPQKLHLNTTEDKQQVSQFLQDENDTPNNLDDIYTITGTKMSVDIAKEDSKFIYLAQQEPSKIDKRQIAAIVYRNGLHSVYPTLRIIKVAEILWTNKAPSFSVKQPDSTTSSAVSKTTTQDPAKTNTTTVPIQTPAVNIHTADTVKTPVEEKNNTLTFEALTGNVSQKEFEEKAIKKTKDLNSYLKILCTKSYGYEEHNKALDQAILLFINEDAAVQVSSITKDEIKSYKIRQYLLRLKSLNYDRVEVEWTNVQYVDKLKKGIDGNYYGTVTLEQVFRGFIDGKVVYEDVTKKSATVVLKSYEKNAEGNTTEMWDVLLSDIGVVYTKSQIQTQ